MNQDARSMVTALLRQPAAFALVKSWVGVWQWQCTQLHWHLSALALARANSKEPEGLEQILFFRVKYLESRKR